MPAIMAEPSATFAERLKAAISVAGHTQRSLAKVLDVSPATVSSWCVGRTVPGLDDACRLARILNVPLESLCDPSWLEKPDGEEDNGE